MSEYKLQTTAPETLECDCLVLGVYTDNVLSSAARNADTASGGVISRQLGAYTRAGHKGRTVVLHEVPGIKASRVLMVGCGEKEKFSGKIYKEVALAATRAIKHLSADHIGWALCQQTLSDRDRPWAVRTTVEAMESAVYNYTQTKSKASEEEEDEDDDHNGVFSAATLLILASDSEKACTTGLLQGQAIASGQTLARDLGNLPGNICTPTYLAEQAKQLADDYGIKTTVLEEADMQKLGMGALLSVSRGSRQPAKLIVMEYSGGKKGDAPIALVGKGLTFDAGGISLKPGANMDEMKFDMCGGASVLGSMKAVAEMKLPLNVVGVVPSSENLPDGDANKPGDIVTSMSGQTIEILNTDAEGRLILCDALTYTEKFSPRAVVDIATLTGACVVALGNHASGLLGNDQDLVDALLAAGETTYDRAWQLPLWDDYDKQLHSNFADMANIGSPGGGTITAACFLARYTKKFKWAHLDIAGTAWVKGKAKGSTGRPVGLLVQYLIDQAGANPV